MNILVIKIGALGDVVRTSFIAQALKDKYRAFNPKLFWLTQENAKSLFINNPYINQIISEKEKGKIAGINFDLIINLEENLEICKFASSLKSNKLIGAFLNEKGKIDYTKETSHWFDMSMISKFGKAKADKLKKMNAKTHRQILSEIIDVNFQKYESFLRLTNWQRKFASDFLRRHNLKRTDKIIGVNTGSADRWPKSLSIKKTAELINNLHKKFNAKILLFGGPNEIERNHEILKLSKAPIIATGCGNDFLEFPALISACSLFITSDSLGLHIALALKRKTICLVGPTSPSELDMYELGKKIVADSKCICCYKNNCKSMEKINLKEIINQAGRLLSQKITLVITAFKEPKISKAIEAALNQKTNYDYDIIISAPDEETLNIARQHAKSNRKIKVVKDAGKGKSFALNMLFSQLNTDIIILTDGDVYLSENSIEDISNLFKNPEIGCVTGHPTPVESRKTKYGYWANFLFDSAHNWRKSAFQNNSFLECSGYLFAFRKKNIWQIPLDVAEDTVIPYLFWEKGFKIGYAENARVYVKNVDNWKDWIKQKTRTGKAHETLSKYVNTSITPRVKTFKNEARGISSLLSYPSNPVELLWTFQLAFARLYMWLKVYKDTKLAQKHYSDAWERAESTK